MICTSLWSWAPYHWVKRPLLSVPSQLSGPGLVTLPLWVLVPTCLVRYLDLLYAEPETSRATYSGSVVNLVGEFVQSFKPNVLGCKNKQAKTTTTIRLPT